MADPISIIKLVALALSAAKATKDFIEDVIDAPNEVSSVARDLGALQSILSQLIIHLQDPVFAEVQAHDQIVAMLAAPLENCAEESRSLQALIRPFVKPSGKAKTRWSRLAFQFRAEEVRNIQQRLSNSRASLDAGVGIATLIISSRSNGKLQEVSRDQNILIRRMNRLLLAGGLDISSAAASSYAASEVLASDAGDSIMNWLAETETVVDYGLFDHEVTRSPDVIVGVAFGLKAIRVAWSSAPSWHRPEMMQRWPGAPGNSLANAVDIILGYESLTDPPKTWGFPVDPYGDQIIRENFVRFLDNEYRDQSPDALTSEQSENYCVDYMSLVYKYLDQRIFEEQIPNWKEKNVDWVFSISHSWKKDPRMMAKMNQIVKAAGFGTVSMHQISIPLSEQEALAYYTIPRHEQTGIVLLCDVGDVTADVSAIRFSANEPRPEATIITFAEGAAIGWALIDLQLEGYLVGQLQKIRGYLGNEPDIVAYRMTRQGRFESYKASYGDDREIALDLPLRIPNIPFNKDFPEADIIDSKILVTRTQLQSWFDTQLEKLFHLVDQELKKLQDIAPAEAITSIAVSGDFGASPYVQREMQARYGRKVSNRNPEVALVSGLVEYCVVPLRKRPQAV